MKVVLTKDVQNLGKRGDVKVVRDGYARNFLIPNKLVVPATKEALEESKKIIQEKENLKGKMKEKLVEYVSKLRKEKIVLTARAQEDGSLFGSITADDIAQKFSEILGETFLDDYIDLEHHIKAIGTFEINIKTGTKDDDVTIHVEEEK